MLPKGCVLECRGCKHREWAMEESLKQKYSFLSTKLSPWVDVLEPVVSVPEGKRWGYRNKTTLSVKWDEKGWHFGMMSRDELIEIPNCPLHKPSVNSILGILREYLPCYEEFPLAFYVQSSAQVVLIVKTKNIVNISWLNEDVVNKLKGFGVEGLWLHHNPSAGRRLFEKTKWELLYGEKRSVDVNGLLYGPGAFQQLIPSLYNQSLDMAASFFDLDKSCSVADLYCGTGTSMKRWSDQKAEVVGVEVGAESVECAKLNVPNATIYRGACRQRVPQIKQWVQEQRDGDKTILLYVNPPRTGIEEEVLDWIVNNGKPQKIAYLSCSAGTLSKNLNVLTSNCYRVARLIPFDFFPQTIHVECLALLERVK